MEMVYFGDNVPSALPTPMVSRQLHNSYHCASTCQWSLGNCFFTKYTLKFSIRNGSIRCENR